jgi:phage baseplate assembly protein W
MDMITLIGFTLIAGMLTNREYGCDKRLAKARTLQSVARFKYRAADKRSLEAYEARCRRVIFQ